MMSQALPRIEDLSAAEEKRAALSYVNEAFAEAILSGVEADCFAQAAIFTALQAKDYGLIDSVLEQREACTPESNSDQS